MTVQDVYPIEPTPRRHPAVEQLKVTVLERATHLRIAATRLEQIVMMMPDDDELFEFAADDFSLALQTFRNCLVHYRDVRDIKGVA